MVSLAGIVVVLVALYAGLTYHFRSKTAFLVGVTITLGFWGAPFVLAPSYANALYVIVGVIGSAVFGSTGLAAWWRSRRPGENVEWSWLVAGGTAALPAIVLLFYELLRR
jgi:uncharacterized membrane protein YedE/YeeE